MYVSMYVCMYVCTYVCMDGWMDGWMDGAWSSSLILSLGSRIPQGLTCLPVKWASQEWFILRYMKSRHFKPVSL